MEGTVTFNRKEQKRVGVLVEVEKELDNRERSSRSDGCFITPDEKTLCRVLKGGYYGVALRKKGFG